MEQRLDVYHDTYIRSGHPRTMLVTMFEKTGEVGFDAVLERMTDSASFYEHFWIILHQSLKGDIDVCDPRLFDRLSQKVERLHRVVPAHPVPVRFDRCEVVL